MLDIKYNDKQQWLLKDGENIVFEIFDDYENDTLEITHYGTKECALRVAARTDYDTVAIGVNSDTIVVFNPRKYICWEHCE